MSLQNSVEENIMGGGMGLGFGGGSGCGLIIIVLLILFVLFKDGGRGHDGAYAMPYPGYGGGCGPCVQPTFKDESNWEQDYHFCKEINHVDRDVIEQGCKDREAIYCDGNKTREYIAHLQERADDKAYSALAMQLAQKENYIQALQIEQNIDGKIAALCGAMEKNFCRTDGMIGQLSCEIPKRPPVFAECVTPNTHDIDCRDRDDRRGFNNFPRRGNCGGCCDDGFGGNFGYAY